MMNRLKPTVSGHNIGHYANQLPILYELCVGDPISCLLAMD